MPQPKKHASARARANKAATTANLVDAEPEDRSGWSIKALRAEVDDRNQGRGDGERLSKGGSKTALMDRLLEDDYAIPSLPDRPQMWHEQTQAWWRDVWMSPMSAEWHPESDWHNVVLAAMHYDDTWRAETALARQKATVLFTKLCDFLGLNPYARRRLEWTIATAEGATEGQRRRRQLDKDRADNKPAPDPAGDPRIRLVK